MRTKPDTNCQYCKIYSDFEFTIYYCTEPSIGNLYSCPCEKDTFYCQYDSRDKSTPFVPSYYGDERDK